MPGRKSDAARKETVQARGKNGARAQQSSPPHDCPICSETYGRKRKVSCIACKQTLHLTCLNQWASTSRRPGEADVSCPFCRSGFRSGADIESTRREVADAERARFAAAIDLTNASVAALRTEIERRVAELLPTVRRRHGREAGPLLFPSLFPLAWSDGAAESPLAGLMLVQQPHPYTFDTPENEDVVVWPFAFE
jgi:hypothetical protein